MSGTNETTSSAFSLAEVDFIIEEHLDANEFIELLKRSGLAARRPIGEEKTIVDMIKNADVMISARLHGRLVALARALTDRSYCTYLSDLAVDRQFQRQGIGRELVKRTHAAAGEHTTLILLAAPDAETYYPHIGMKKHQSCWLTPRKPVSMPTESR